MSAAPKYLPGNDNVLRVGGPKLLVEWEPRWRSFCSSLRPALATLPLFPDDPALLVRWESRWQAFTAALRPALSSSEQRLANECTVSMRPGSGTVASVLLHIAGIFFLISVPLQIARLGLFSPPSPEVPQFQVVYYSKELPQMNDVGGAQMGASGRSGGRELYHP